MLLIVQHIFFDSNEYKIKSLSLLDAASRDAMESLSVLFQISPRNIFKKRGMV